MNEAEKHFVREFVKEAEEKYPDALESVAVFHTNIRWDKEGEKGGFRSRQEWLTLDKVESFLAESRAADFDFTGVVMRTIDHFPMAFSLEPKSQAVIRFSILYQTVLLLAERAGVEPPDMQTVMRELAKGIKDARGTKWIN